MEILMGEDDLARVCCYCGNAEFVEPMRYTKCNGDPAQPQYMCPTVGIRFLSPARNRC